MFLSQRKEGFSVLSGDDNITLDLIKEGGNGVVSVASNIVPKKMSDMVKLALDGQYEEASKLNEELGPLFEVEFVETNPIPIKYMFSILSKLMLLISKFHQLLFLLSWAMLVL